LCALVAGCEPNTADSFLIPTGIRPPLENPTASVTGVVLYDPGQYPDLGTAPFPATVVDLVGSGVVVQSDTTGGPSAGFQFERVQPGTYTITARAAGFLSASINGVTVREAGVDAGNVTLPTNPSAYDYLIGLVGTMAGYDVDNYYANLLESSALGLWTTSFPVDLPAGTTRFKFVTDPSIPDDLPGWGGDTTQVIPAPVTHAPVTFASGPARDLKVSLATAGSYYFQLDARRQTFSLIPPDAAANVLAFPTEAVAHRRTR
jgi:hypothetical protein